ncbi:MAG: DNA-binding protein [Thermoproteus sp.]
MKAFNVTDFKEVTRTVATGLYKIVSEARGNCVSFTPRRVLEFAGIDTTAPIALTLVKHILEGLTARGLVVKDDSRSKVRYIICRGRSQLWEPLKNGAIEEVTDIIYNSVE